MIIKEICKKLSCIDPERDRGSKPHRKITPSPVTIICPPRKKPIDIAFCWRADGGQLRIGRLEKACLRGVCEQHPCRLISAFVIRLLESIISRLATRKLLIFCLVSVAEETGLVSLCQKPQRQVLSRQGPKLVHIYTEPKF